VPQIDREYVRTGKVKYVVLDFPITGLHPQAFKGHEAARCAGEQGKFWEMHRRLFANQHAMSSPELEDHARTLGLDLARFRECLSSDKYAADIRKDLEEGQRAGVTGTPMFFIGLTDPKALKLKVSRAMSGAQSFDRFKEAIDSLLEASGR
jgi:protein-disulfide isomerase